jgi:hypothetical protein
VERRLGRELFPWSGEWRCVIGEAGIGRLHSFMRNCNKVYRLLQLAYDGTFCRSSAVCDHLCQGCSCFGQMWSSECPVIGFDVTETELN